MTTDNALNTTLCLSCAYSYHLQPLCSMIVKHLYTVSYFQDKISAWFHHASSYEITWLKALNVPILSLRKRPLASVTV